MMESIDKGRRASISDVGKGPNSTSAGSNDEDGMNFADIFDDIRQEEINSNRNNRKNKDERDYLMSLAADDVVTAELAKDRGRENYSPSSPGIPNNRSVDHGSNGNKPFDEDTTAKDRRDDLSQTWSENIESVSGQFLDEDPQSVVENEIDFSAILQPGVELSSGSLENPFDLLSMTELMDPDLRIESNPQQIISRIVQASGSHGSISEKLADIVYPQIIRSFATLVRGENAEMRLQLQPGDLGEIELRVRTTEAIVRGEMMVQNPEVKALLEKHMERLRVALAEEGLHLGSFDVDLGKEGSSESMDEEEENTTPFSNRTMNPKSDNLELSEARSLEARLTDNDLDITA